MVLCYVHNSKYICLISEKFEEVTILFSDIVTFTNIASAVQPMQIVHMLNELYYKFDMLTETLGVYKVSHYIILSLWNSQGLYHYFYIENMILNNQPTFLN